MPSFSEKVLGSYSGSTSGVHLIGTVPTGKVWRVMFGTAINHAGGSIEISMFITRGTTDFTFLDQLAVPLAGVATFEGRVNAEAGDKLQIYVSAAHLVRAWFSGLEITP